MAKSSHAYIRCVRRGPTPRSSRFTRDLAWPDNPVVLDNTTGLEWQGCAAGLSGSLCDEDDAGTAATYTWQEALDYCQDLSWASHSDWILPDIKELMSIADNHVFNPAIDSDAFPATPPGFFMSSSTTFTNTAAEWYVDFNNGKVNAVLKSTGSYVRCVRQDL